MFAMAFYKQALEEKSHQKFLSKFIQESEIDNLENKWLEITQKNNK